MMISLILPQVMEACFVQRITQFNEISWNNKPPVHINTVVNYIFGTGIQICRHVFVLPNFIYNYDTPLNESKCEGFHK